MKCGSASFFGISLIIPRLCVIESVPVICPERFVKLAGRPSVPGLLSESMLFKASRHSFSVNCPSPLVDSSWFSRVLFLAEKIH